MVIYNELNKGGKDMIDYVFNSIISKHFPGSKIKCDKGKNEYNISIRKKTTNNTYTTLLIININFGGVVLVRGSRLKKLSVFDTIELIINNIKSYKKYNNRNKVIDGLL